MTTSIETEGEAHTSPPILEASNASDNSRDQRGVVPEVDFTSDAFWINLQRLHNERLLNGTSACSLLGNDQKQHEVRKAEMKLVMDQVWRSYEDPKQMWIWSIIMFAIPALALVPVMGATYGIFFATFTVLFWSVVHRVRRL